tara:strand:- start:5 stop:277 length:273 start_codon:yes stop_codon:yes gene_type:complete
MNMKINPINFTKRRLNFCPPHFATTVVDATYFKQEEYKIEKWIYESCFGRYALVEDWISDHKSSRQTVIKIGFEKPSDMMLFALSGLVKQ